MLQMINRTRDIATVVGQRRPKNPCLQVFRIAFPDIRQGGIGTGGIAQSQFQFRQLHAGAQARLRIAAGTFHGQVTGAAGG